MKKKFASVKGFTVVEVLLSTAILAIFISIALVGQSMIFQTGGKMINVSKAAVLGSDVMKVITNEIRFGENFSLDATTAGDSGTGSSSGSTDSGADATSDTINYNSTTYGENSQIGLETGMLIIAHLSTAVDAEGNTSTAVEKTFHPLGTAAYDEVRIKSIAFSIGKTADNHVIVSCTVSITDDGTAVLWEKTVSAVPLQQKTL